MEELAKIIPPPVKTDRVRRSYLLGGVVAFLVCASFIGGNYWGIHKAVAKGASCSGEQQTAQVTDRSAAPTTPTRDISFSEYWKVWDIVKERHVAQDAQEEKMFYGSIAGMVASLGDPYSVFFDPKTAQMFNDELSGTFEGIGAQIGVKKEQLQIIAPLPGTPADKAGLRPADKILAIDDIDTLGMPVDEAVMKIRGKGGTVVRLLIMREDWKEPKEFKIIRATIQTDSVTWKMVRKDGKRLAVITVTNFNEDTEALFTTAARSLSLENPDGIILDLRNNPGGFLDTAVKMAGEWSPNTVIVREKFADGQSTQEYKSEGGALFEQTPTIVLVNGGSASASEIVAGALKDLGKARIVGEKTYGKGSVQELIGLDDGAALKLTVALWYTPSDHNINKEGIAPDIEVKRTPEDYDNDLDPQMDKAVNILLGKDDGSVPTAAATVTP